MSLNLTPLSQLIQDADNCSDYSLKSEWDGREEFSVTDEHALRGPLVLVIITIARSHRDVIGICMKADLYG